MFRDELILKDFYKMYLTQPEEGISIDTTALPNQIDLEMSQWGYSTETMDEEIKLILVMDRKRNRPFISSTSRETSWTFPLFPQRTVRWRNME